jgi:acetyl-CoA carboxylase carboxyl transferase subunit beta
VHPDALFERTLGVCPSCGHHLRLSARKRIHWLLDRASFAEWDARLVSCDPLGFVDATPYPERLRRAQQATGEREAVITGTGRLAGLPVAVAAFEFGFMGGSMGCAVGEKIVRLFRRARARRIPAVTVAASGGARMQEGPLALLQMAKVVVAIDAFRRARLPFVSVLTDPTTGGVAASLAMLGDVVVAEPGALVAFAGPRVIEQTIRAPLPPGFQRAERLLERGLVDAVVPRADLRAWVATVLDRLWRPEDRA